MRPGKPLLFSRVFHNVPPGTFEAFPFPQSHFPGRKVIESEASTGDHRSPAKKCSFRNIFNLPPMQQVSDDFSADGGEVSRPLGRGALQMFLQEHS
jgi:hypothetical protein